jgi:hypothetical protein
MAAAQHSLTAGTKDNGRSPSPLSANQCQPDVNEGLLPVTDGEELGATD